MLGVREHLRELIQGHCLLTDGDFVLSTGRRSSFYFDCKRITLSGEGLTLIADLMLEEIDRLPLAPTAIGGLTMGADFITAAVIVRAFQTHRGVLHGAIARKEPKAHGTMKRVENELPRGTRIVLVDDVVTSGASIIKAAEVFQQEGYEIAGALAVVDREQGGMDTLRRLYGGVTALFRASEFPQLVRLQGQVSPEPSVV